MHDSLTVDMCVGIRKGCPMGYLVTPDGQVEFSFGGGRDGFNFAFDVTSLRDFLVVGAEALAEMECRAAHRVEQAAAEAAGLGRRSA